VLAEGASFSRRQEPVKKRRERTVYLNGRFLPASAAYVRAEDRGILYGDGLFETIRVYRGRPFALDAHLLRLRRAGERTRLRIPGGSTWWAATIVELLRRNRLDAKDAAVRLTITRGIDAGLGLLPPRRPRQTVLVSARPVAPHLAKWQRRGVAVVLLPFSPGSRGYLSGVKTTDYLTALLGKAIAHEQGAFEGIYCTSAGRVLEGTTSNLFVIRGNLLVTPPLAAGILPGITRAEVLGLARRAGLRPRERALHVRELQTADEAFLTASTIEIVPIRTVNRSRVGHGHPKTRELQTLFRLVISKHFSQVSNLGTKSQIPAKTVSS
jgi:branched-subunit amino acid aminotransferase/4-amino-4-deoxychorismate lyase